ncbi:MAG TPA: hypothetical protein PLP33_27105 [Leptospiraceae bacterium]|nr:hypothetical protein [Leptospiraceae bacterium]
MTTKLKNIAIVIVTVLVIGVFAYLKFTGYGTKNELVTNKEVHSINSEGFVAKAGALASDASAVKLPPEPVNGKTAGVAVLGASGYDSFVAELDHEHYKVISKKFGNSLAYEGLTSDAEVKTQLKDYLAQMLNFGAKPSNVHFIVSSGALKEGKTEQIAQAIQKSGFVVNRITAEQEGIYALKAAMHPEYKNRAFVVDIGSGNTKISWYDETGKAQTRESVGAKYFQNGLLDSDVFSGVQRIASQVPQERREICFLIGGVPNSLAKRNGGSGRYTKLNALDSYSAKDKKEASGLNILKAIQAGTNVGQFVFDDMANFGIGFLMSIK